MEALPTPTLPPRYTLQTYRPSHADGTIPPTLLSQLLSLIDAAYGLGEGGLFSAARLSRVASLTPREHFLEQVGSDGYTIVLTERGGDGTPVGTISVRPPSPDSDGGVGAVRAVQAGEGDQDEHEGEFEIHLLAVHPSATKQGLGGILLAVAEDFVARLAKETKTVTEREGEGKEVKGVGLIGWVVVEVGLVDWYTRYGYRKAIADGSGDMFIPTGQWTCTRPFTLAKILKTVKVK